MVAAVEGEDAVVGEDATKDLDEAVAVGGVAPARHADPRVVHVQRLEDLFAHVAPEVAAVDPAHQLLDPRAVPRLGHGTNIYCPTTSPPLSIGCDPIRREGEVEFGPNARRDDQSIPRKNRKC